MSRVSTIEFAEWAAEQYAIALIPTDRTATPPLSRQASVLIAGVPGTWKNPPPIDDEGNFIYCPLLKAMPMHEAWDLLHRIDLGWRYDGIKFGRTVAGDDTPQLGLFEAAA